MMTSERILTVRLVKFIIYLIILFFFFNIRLVLNGPGGISCARSSEANTITKNANITANFCMIYSKTCREQQVDTNTKTISVNSIIQVIFSLKRGCKTFNIL